MGLLFQNIQTLFSLDCRVGSWNYYLPGKLTKNKHVEGCDSFSFPISSWRFRGQEGSKSDSQSILKYQLMGRTLEKLRLVCLEKLFPRLLTTLCSFQINQRARVTREASSIESSKILCFKEVTSPREMELAEDQFMEKSLQMRTSS